MSEQAEYFQDELTVSSKIGTVGDYISLLKPRVMSLVVFTGFIGFMLAPNSSEVHPFLSVVAIVCIAIASGAAGAINMWYEHDTDAIMTRTKMRPIPRGKIAPDDALAFGVVLALLSILMMGVALNWVAAGLLATAALFYVFVYTIWLKRRTPQNIVIGGAAGAFPPMIGWAAVTGSVELGSLALFAIIFFWTPPHFWALALYRNEDYTKAKIPMMPVVAGAKSTKLQMLIYTLILSLVSLTPYILNIASDFYLISALLLNAIFIKHSLAVYFADDKDHKASRKMFFYSIFYLFALFAALMIGDF